MFKKEKDDSDERVEPLVRVSYFINNYRQLDVDIRTHKCIS